MKRLITLVAVMMGLLGATTDVASAAQPENCNGGTLVSADYVLRGTAQVGSIQLCRRGDDYYAMYINYGTVAGGHYANAELTRYYDGVQHRWTCDSQGGNKHVQAGYTWCVTPSVHSPNTIICNRYDCR